MIKWYPLRWDERNEFKSYYGITIHKNIVFFKSLIDEILISHSCILKILTDSQNNDVLYGYVIYLKLYVIKRKSFPIISRNCIKSERLVGSISKFHKVDNQCIIKIIHVIKKKRCKKKLKPD